MKRVPQINLSHVENPGQEYFKYAAQLKAFIKEFWLLNSYGPNLQEIADHMGFKSRSTSLYWLDRMAHRGDILMSNNQYRTTRLPGMVISFPEPSQQPDSENIAV